MSRWRIVAVIAPGALTSLAALFIDPIPQDPNYHDFADQWVFFEIPHFGDVITNIGFEMYYLSGWLRGHSLKHVLAALGA